MFGNEKIQYVHILDLDEREATLSRHPRGCTPVKRPCKPQSG
jgi:hypothetical protein